MPSFNSTRVIALDALTATLDDLVGRNGVSEKMFHAEWQRRLGEHPDVFADGWYDPPPLGMSVLFGDRSNCKSLREREFWPSNHIIDWRKDLFSAYCSPVGKTDGLPGDVSLTLYFGASPAIKSHFKTTHAAISDVLDQLEAGAFDDSFSIVYAANAVFARSGSRNMVFSTTDPASINLGHTFPAIEIDPAQTALTLEQKAQIRMSRLYLNAVTKWEFSDYMQFTFEPQLVSLYDPALPKIKYHYLARGGDTFNVCRNVDAVMKIYGLI